jgi:hypothetical protein
MRETYKFQDFRSFSRFGIGIEIEIEIEIVGGCRNIHVM